MANDHLSSKMQQKTDVVQAEDLLSLELDKKLATERLARESAFIAQEHRLIPAIANLVSALINKSPDERRELLPKAVSAVFWCMLPSCGTAGVGIVAVLSLLLAWQQVRLLNVQNEKIEVQNILAEAQRRSGLMIETSAIFQQIEDEKTLGKLCNNYVSEKCWTSKRTGGLFVPSSATIGRLAALTQALRPYRYLSVEDQGPYRFRNNDNDKEICPDSISDELLQHAAMILRGDSIGENGKPNPAPTDIKALQSSIENRALEIGAMPSSFRWLESVRNWALQSTESLPWLFAGTKEIRTTSISCKASSPERGQLLIALHGASIDISKIVSKGADFRFADLPGAQLRGIVLHGVDLSNSRLPGASFLEGNLEDVNFSGAHLAGAKFSRAKLKEIRFNNAIIQGSGTQGTSASLLSADMTDSSFNGIRMIEYGRAEPFFARWCIARKLMLTQVNVSRLADLEPYALITEIRTHADGTPDVMQAIFVKRTLDVSVRLLSIRTGSSSITMSYQPFTRCGKDIDFS
jgi:hypothetical protein